MRLDPDTPMLSLRLLSGLTQTEAAQARGIRTPSQADSENQGNRILLATLLAAAEAFGFNLAISATKTAPKKKNVRGP